MTETNYTVHHILKTGHCVIEPGCQANTTTAGRNIGTQSISALFDMLTHTWKYITMANTKMVEKRLIKLGRFWR